MNVTTAAGQQVRVLKSGFGSAAMMVPAPVVLLDFHGRPGDLKRCGRPRGYCCGLFELQERI
jgi:hypothetical protein